MWLTGDDAKDKGSISWSISLLYTSRKKGGETEKETKEERKKAMKCQIWKKWEKKIAKEVELRKYFSMLWKFIIVGTHGTFVAIVGNAIFTLNLSKKKIVIDFVNCASFYFHTFKNTLQGRITRRTGNQLWSGYPTRESHKIYCQDIQWKDLCKTLFSHVIYRGGFPQNLLCLWYLSRRISPKPSSFMISVKEDFTKNLIVHKIYVCPSWHLLSGDLPKTPFAHNIY